MRQRKRWRYGCSTVKGHAGQVGRVQSGRYHAIVEGSFRYRCRRCHILWTGACGCASSSCSAGRTIDRHWRDSESSQLAACVVTAVAAAVGAIGSPRLSLVTCCTLERLGPRGI